jgi:hypothetical protein
MMIGAQVSLLFMGWLCARLSGIADPERPQNSIP